MKAIFRLALAISLLLAATSSYAWFGNNNRWGGGDWNPYDEWDPRYWMEEMENEWDDDDDYYGPGYGGYGPGYGGYGPGYGGYGPGYGGYGPGYGGYGPGYGGYGPGYGYGPGPGYGGYGPGYAPAPAPYAAPPQQTAPAQPQR